MDEAAATNPENHADAIRRFVDKCPHSTADGAEQ
jgi:hypothetical protein